MGTTLAEDNQKFTDVINTFSVSTSAGSTLGALVYAGALWPAGVANPTAPTATPAGRQMRREIDYAFGEARALATAGFMKATAACRGDEAAGLMMKKWFGSRATSGNDWWLGAQRIIGRIQAMLSNDINLYYRGDDSLIGQPDDYPGASGNLTANDVRGYAETGADDADGNIGLCKLFFRRESGGVFKTAQTGRDSIGGCLVHELSHNYCGTDDHDAVGGGSCYGEADCRELARKRKRQAWYNADNIEYFCEDAHYGIVAGKAAITSGAISSVVNIRAAHAQIAAALTPTAPKTVLPGGPKPATQVTGAVSLLRAQIAAAAVAQDPTLSVDPQPSTSKGKVAALASQFGGQ